MTVQEMSTGYSNKRQGRSPDFVLVRVTDLRCHPSRGIYFLSTPPWGSFLPGTKGCYTDDGKWYIGTIWCNFIILFRAIIHIVTNMTIKPWLYNIWNDEGIYRIAQWACDIVFYGYYEDIHFCLDVRNWQLCGTGGVTSNKGHCLHRNQQSS